MLIPYSCQVVTDLKKTGQSSWAKDHSLTLKSTKNEGTRSKDEFLSGIDNKLIPKLILSVDKRGRRLHSVPIFMHSSLEDRAECVDVLYGH